MGEENDKLLKLRTAQYNILRVRGIDLLLILKIFEKYEKGLYVTEMEAEQYNAAFKILRRENCADVFLNKYYKMDEEDMQVLREKFKETVREYSSKEPKPAVEKKEEPAGFKMKSETGRGTKPTERPTQVKKGSPAKPGKKKSEWDGLEQNPKGRKKILQVVVAIVLMAVLLYLVFGDDEATKKKKAAALKQAQQQAQKSTSGK